MYCTEAKNPEINWDEYETKGYQSMHERYSKLLDAIGSARLLALPDDVKLALQRERVLARKVEMLELVAKHYELEV